MSLGVIVLIVLATRTIQRICLLILYISKVAKVAATELLKVQSARYIPTLVLVITCVDNAVGVL